LSDADRLVVNRARRLQRFLTQPLLRLRAVYRPPRTYVPLHETLRGFQEIVQGHHDHLPEQAFYMAARLTKSSKRPGN
jgi:F-type H+-transporting ATPase subunit beta